MQSFISLLSTKESIERKKATLKESLPIQDIEIANTRLHMMLVTFSMARLAIPFF
jgi:hypothetical protein